MRTFVAIDLPDEIRDALAEGSRYLRDTVPALADARWVDPRNYHVTLSFLGEMTPGEVAALGESLRIACASVRPFDLRLSDALSPARATMLWASLNDVSGECAALSGLISGVAARFGIDPPSRRFSPHVTLARMRRPTSIDAGSIAAASRAVCAALDQPSPVMSVHRVTVYTSERRRSGAAYTRQATIVLNGR